MDIEYKGEKFHLAVKFRNRGEQLLVFLHGLGCTKESFEDIWDRKDFSNYSILTFDLPGFGDSSKPENFSYSMEEQAIIVSLLLNKFNYSKINIVVHSMGGAIGVLLAEKLGRKGSTFISVEGNLIAEDCNTSRKIISFSFEEFRDKKFQEIKNNFKNSSKRSYQLWAKWMEKTSALICYKSAKSLVEWSDSGKLLAKFKKQKNKKIYIYGEESYRQKVKLLRLLDDIPSVEISNSEHFVMNDNPQEFYQILSKVLNQ